MNPGRGRNPDLGEPYHLEYSEFEAKIFISGTSGLYIWPLKILVLETSEIQRYSECTKTTRFSILGFFRPWVTLGFDFPRVLLNQKIQTWSLNFNLDEERNTMLGSLKNSSSVKKP